MRLEKFELSKVIEASVNLFAKSMYELNYALQNPGRLALVAMVRKFKHHEQRLLRKVDFLEWKGENAREQTMVGRFHMERREDYLTYNKICGHITRLAHLVSLLDPADAFRQQIAEQLVRKLYSAGILPSPSGSLSQLARVSAASLCRRRLAAVLVSPLRMCQNMDEASRLVRQGHVRIGPETATDPALLVTRAMEDLVTWAHDSKIRRKIAEYHGTVDDFDA